MGKMKIFIRLFLVVASLVLVLAACNENKPQESNAGTTGNPSTTAGQQYTNLAATATATDMDNAEEAQFILDGKTETYWTMGALNFITIDFGKQVTFNAINLTYSGDAEAWSVRYSEGDQWYAIPGASRRLEESKATPYTVKLAVDPVTTDKIIINFDLYGSNVKIHDVEVYNIPDQDPVDSRNAYVTELHNRLLKEIDAGANGAFDVFPESSYKDIKNMGTVTYTDNRTAVKFELAKWAAGLDEAKVFNKELAYKSPDGSNDITIRIGNGGQIYSFMTPAGELIPPQNKGAEWMDEVWQVVTVAHGNMLSRDEHAATFYIHQAGMYKGRDKEELNLMTDTFYTPRLAEHWDEETKTMSTLNLGCLSVAPNMWRSKVPIITQTRFIGDGMLEMTYGVTNYGDYTLDFFNFPWGGARKSNFPHIVMSNTDGSYYHWTVGLWDEGKQIEFKDTGGWIAFAEDVNDPDSYAVAWVFGRDDYNDGTITPRKVVGPSLMETFDAIRDQYNCANTMDRFRVKQDEMFYARIYVVTGKLSEVAQKANDMVQYVQRGYITINEEDASVRGIYQSTDSETGKTVWLPGGEGNPLFYVYDRHVTGSRPLYLLYDNVAKEFVASVDPYICTNKLPLGQFLDVTKAPYKRYADNKVAVPYDGTTDYIGILGYVMTSDAVEGDGYTPLSEVGGIFRGTGDEDNLIVVKKTQ